VTSPLVILWIIPLNRGKIKKWKDVLLAFELGSIIKQLEKNPINVIKSNENVNNNAPISIFDLIFINFSFKATS